MEDSPDGDRALVDQWAPSSAMENCPEIQNELRNERAAVRSNADGHPVQSAFVLLGQAFESRVLRHTEPLEQVAPGFRATESGSKVREVSGTAAKRI